MSFETMTIYFFFCFNSFIKSEFYSLNYVSNSTQEQIVKSTLIQNKLIKHSIYQICKNLRKKNSFYG